MSSNEPDRTQSMVVALVVGALVAGALVAGTHAGAALVTDPAGTDRAAAGDTLPPAGTNGNVAGDDESLTVSPSGNPAALRPRTGLQRVRNGTGERVATRPVDRDVGRSAVGNESVRNGSTAVSAGPSATSDGLDEINADDVHDLGYRGDNVTAAVIDSTGLDVDNPEIRSNLVATYDATDYGVADGRPDSHGTKAAEVLVDVAPNVDLVYVRAVTEEDVRAALAWLETNDHDEDVVSMSKGFSNDAGPLDGTAGLDRAIEDFVANESAPFVVGAGNAADENLWQGAWADPDGDGVLDHGNGTEGGGGDGRGSERFRVTGTDFETTLAGEISVSWNAWDGNAPSDYRVRIHYDNGTTETVDERADEPYETFDTDGKRASFEVIREESGSPPTNRTVTVSSVIHTISPNTDAGSVKIPAAGENVIAVGATGDDGTGTKTELVALSSRGPTVDGRIKPDLVAPTNVTTSADASFGGTSAATPHVAGVVALVVDAMYARDPGDVSHREVATALRENANGTANYARADLPNNQVGYGLVDALATIRGIETTTPATTATPPPTATPSPTDSSTPTDSPTSTLTWSPSPTRSTSTAETPTSTASAVTSASPTTAGTNAQRPTSDRTSGRETDAASATGDAGPGFTPLATVLALLTVVLLGRRRGGNRG